MSADATQAILSRLYTDSSFRNEFVANKEHFYKNNGIVSKEIIDYVNAIPVEQIVFFAKGLYSKRMHEVKGLIPVAAKLIDKKFHELFLKYTEKYSPTGIHKHHDDALHFIDYLKEMLLLRPEEGDEFLISVLAYEEKRIRNFIFPKKHSISIFKYDHLKHYQTILKTSELNLPSKKFTVVYWKNGKGMRVF